MSESTLGITRDELRLRIGRKAGFSSDPLAWDASETQLVDDVIKSGLRQFYCPPRIRDGQPAHQWSFLAPTATLVAWASLAATAANTLRENIVHVSGSTTLDATLPTFFETMVGASIAFADGSGSYTITAYVSSTRVVVAGDVPSPTTPRQFSMTTTGNYPLPDDFGAIYSEPTLQSPELDPTPLTITAESIIRVRRNEALGTARPRECAIVPRRITPGNGQPGQRFEIQLAPIPDVNYTLALRYQVLPEVLSGSPTFNVYPYGGAAHSETILNSCLAILARDWEDDNGIAEARFRASLAASIDRDLENAPRSLGFSESHTSYRQRGYVLRVQGSVV